MTKPILDDATIDLLPYEAADLLKRLVEIYGGAISVREATELHRLEKRLKARTGSQ